MVSETKQSKRKLEHWMGVSVLLAVYDVVAANISYLFALLLRFDFVYSNIPQRYIEAYLHFAPIYSVVVVGVFIACRLYNSIWRFAGVRELTKTFIANVIVVFFADSHMLQFVPHSLTCIWFVHTGRLFLSSSSVCDNPANM